MRKNDMELQELVDEILADACEIEEQLTAFLTIIEEELELPTDAYVLGESVQVLRINYDGNERRGLTAVCRREDREYKIGLAEITFPRVVGGGKYPAAYRLWSGLTPWPPDSFPKGGQHSPKATADDIRAGESADLVVLAVKESAVRCRVPGTLRELTLRTADVWRLVPGEIITVAGKKQWMFARHCYISGSVSETRLRVGDLGLVPLKLEERGTWDPKEKYWGEEGEPISPCLRPIIEFGPRSEFGMEMVIPGEDPDSIDDPILEAMDIEDAGDVVQARRILMELFARDLRCLDAHALLGNFTFNQPEKSIRHYEVGVRIGELSFPAGFNGVLSWGFIDNRPFLRCLHGYGFCLWRFGRFREAVKVFERLLWLSPRYDQGIRFFIEEVRAGRPWTEDE